jgi:Zn finger protein HypA/HybF involved in hydrogenase expression
MNRKRRWRPDSDRPDCESCGWQSGDSTPALACPGCGADSDLLPYALAREILNHGRQARACYECEEVSFVFDLDMVCQPCDGLRPDVNDRLRTRFNTLGPGDPADAPCVGCGEYLTPRATSQHGPPLEHFIEDPICGNWISIPESGLRVGEGLRLMCGECRKFIVVPPIVWCPKCGQHIRREGISPFVRVEDW